MSAPSQQEPVVFVVDDDASVREAVSSVLRSVGLRVHLCDSAKAFMQEALPDVPSCLVLDVRLPGMSGLDFQTELERTNISIPIVFMTAHGDIPMTVQAMKAGAVEFLAKPFRSQEMLDAVHLALERDRHRRESERACADLRSRFETLTPREKEVMDLVVSGLLNKQIAGKTEVKEVTVKLHRASVMRKMKARSLADLVRMAVTLGVGPH